jgi:2,3,4,5-tetrahydropyridine-2-carboxylate N-succinyltransferase
MTDLSTAIEAAWDKRDQLGVTSKGVEREAVEAALEALDNGSLRVAEKIDGAWKVHEWLKKAVLLSFRLNDMKLISGAPGEAVWWDKVDSKFLGWDEARFRAAGFRAVPGAVVRKSAFIAKGAVLMPSFVNVGARNLLLKGERQKFLAEEWPRVAATIQRLGLTPEELLKAAAKRRSSSKTAKEER